MRKRVGFWKHVAFEVRFWWDEQIEQGNFKLIGWLILAFGPFIASVFGPMFISILLESLWPLLAWFLIIPSAFWLWYMFYLDDPEYERVADKNSEAKP